MSSDIICREFKIDINKDNGKKRRFLGRYNEHILWRFEFSKKNFWLNTNLLNFKKCVSKMQLEGGGVGGGDLVADCLHHTAGVHGVVEEEVVVWSIFVGDCLDDFLTHDSSNDGTDRTELREEQR